MKPYPSLATDITVHTALTAQAAVAFGVSGGKDSDATVLVGMDYLDSIGHTGPRILIHADLGRTEWQASLPQCQRLMTGQWGLTKRKEN